MLLLYYLILYFFITIDSNHIKKENLLPGTVDWFVRQPQTTDYPSILGFTTRFSYLPGDKVKIKLHSNKSSTISLYIYRLGYYQGIGARLIDQITIKSSNNNSFFQQPNCLIEIYYRLIDCNNWYITYEWIIPIHSITGLYVILPKDNNNEIGNYIPFIVRQLINIYDTSLYPIADIAFKTSDTTWVAYNKYGSYNVYRGNGSLGFDSRAYQVSYNRPFINRLLKHKGQYENFIFGAEYPLIYWLEQQGYSITYLSCYDVEMFSKLNLFNHHIINSQIVNIFNVLLSVGHDEYWTFQMKQAYYEARNNGINLMFLSGNEIFWSIRWSFDNLSINLPIQLINTTDGIYTKSNLMNNKINNELNEWIEPRIIICYKETIDLTYNISYLSYNSSNQWTGTFIDNRFPDIYKPSYLPNYLTSQLFGVNGFRNDSIFIHKNELNLWFWRNTKQHFNESKKHEVEGVLGYEWDIFSDDCNRPFGYIGLSSTRLRISGQLIESYGASYKGSGLVNHKLSMYRYINDNSNNYQTNNLSTYLTVYQYHNLTSLVFGAGTIQFSYLLSSFHDGPYQSTFQPIQQAIVNMLADMNAQPTTLSIDLIKSVKSYSKIPPKSHINKPNENKIEKCIDHVIKRFQKFENKITNQNDNQFDNKKDKKIDSRKDSQLVIRTDSKLDSQLDYKLDSQLANKIDSQLHSKINSQLDSKVDSQLDTEIDSQLDNIITAYQSNHKSIYVSKQIIIYLLNQLDYNISTILSIYSSIYSLIYKLGKIEISGYTKSINNIVTSIEISFDNGISYNYLPIKGNKFTYYYNIFNIKNKDCSNNNQLKILNHNNIIYEILQSVFLNKTYNQSINIITYAVDDHGWIEKKLTLNNNITIDFILKKCL